MHPPLPVVAFGGGHKLEQSSYLCPVLNAAMLRLLLLQPSACDLFDIMPKPPSDIHCRLIIRGAKERTSTWTENMTGASSLLWSKGIEERRAKRRWWWTCGCKQSK
jgi:hypothetical protein